MQKLIIKGRRELIGKISISGSKNATLPILAASILSNRTIIKNVPLVKDIFTMVELLNFIGLKTKIIRKRNTIEINNTEKKINTLAPYKLVKTMRAGVLVLGSLLTKYGKAKVSFANKEYSFVNGFLVKIERILFSSKYLYTKERSKLSGKKYCSNA